jgi:peptide/nickel transport system substrate-binding protein
MAREGDIIIDVEVVDVTRYFADMEYKAPFYADTWDNRQTINATLKQFYITGGSNNCSNLSDPELDEILLAAESETDFEARRDLYWQAMERISNLAVTIIPYYKSYYVAYGVGLENVFAHPMTYMWLDTAWWSE